MTQVTVQKVPRSAVVPTTARPVRRRPDGGRRAGRAGAPALRPFQIGLPPSARTSTAPPVRSCVIPPPAPAWPTRGIDGSGVTWRLTERGVGVVLVLGLMIMVAALTVIALTAVTVTGEGYRPSVPVTLPA